MCTFFNVTFSCKKMYGENIDYYLQYCRRGMYNNNFWSASLKLSYFLSQTWQEASGSFFYKGNTLGEKKFENP